MKSAPAFLGNFIKELGPAAKQAALGTGLTAGFGLLTGGPAAALAYGAGDFLLNVPAIALARSFSPGTARTLMQVDKNNKPIIDPKTKKPIVKDVQDPSMLQNIANIGASVATYPVVDVLTQVDYIKIDYQLHKSNIFIPVLDLYLKH